MKLIRAIRQKANLKTTFRCISWAVLVTKIQTVLSSLRYVMNSILLLYYSTPLNTQHAIVHAYKHSVVAYTLIQLVILIDYCSSHSIHVSVHLG